MIAGPELANILSIKPQAIHNLRTRYELIDEVDTILSASGRRFYTPVGVRKIFNKRGLSSEPKVVSICNVKGGVGKTTIAVHLARKTASLGFKTLLIDCDKQANATDQIWPEGINKKFPSLLDVVRNKVEMKDCIVEINSHLSIIPSNLGNQLIDIHVGIEKTNSGEFFKNGLSGHDYDLIIFDTEPSFSSINLMALIYSNLNIAPVRLDKNSIDGLELLLDFIQKQKRQWQQMELETKVLINGYDKRMQNEAWKKVSDIEELGLQTFTTNMRIDQGFVRSQETGEIKNNSKAYEDIAALASELLGLTGLDSKIQ